MFLAGTSTGSFETVVAIGADSRRGVQRRGCFPNDNLLTGSGARTANCSRLRSAGGEGAQANL